MKKGIEYMSIEAYKCPNCGEALWSEGRGLVCKNHHFFGFALKTSVPVFACENDEVNSYTIDQAAEIHDNGLIWLLNTFGSSEEDLRRRLISRLELSKGQKILVTGVGGGNDLPGIAQQIGESGQIFAQDFAKQMLLSAIERAHSRYNLGRYNIDYSVSDATHLPYRDRFFDAAYHFGGLNLFSDIRRGILEMDRVVKNGGRVVFGDEGLAPWLKHTEYGRMIINNNPLCDCEIPLQFLPTTARNVRVSWELGYYFYVVDYTVCDQPLFLNPNVWHLGRRGGTMHARYHGVLEGIDPNLKEKIYSAAEFNGISRVEFLQEILSVGLAKYDEIQNA
jgi:SAM-dependent methyltransferase